MRINPGLTTLLHHSSAPPTIKPQPAEKSTHVKFSSDELWRNVQLMIREGEAVVGGRTIDGRAVLDDGQ